MAAFSSWMEANWFSVVQTIGIFIGFWITAKTFQFGNLLTMCAQHDELWARVQDDPRLSRVLAKDADLSEPPTLVEREFLNSAIIHFQNGWRVAKASDREELKLLALDAHEFFSLPLPRTVWEKTKKFRIRKFVQFVDRAIAVRF